VLPYLTSASRLLSVRLVNTVNPLSAAILGNASRKAFVTNVSKLAGSGPETPTVAGVSKSTSLEFEGCVERDGNDDGDLDGTTDLDGDFEGVFDGVTDGT